MDYELCEVLRNTEAYFSLAREVAKLDWQYAPIGSGAWTAARIFLVGSAPWIVTLRLLGALTGIMSFDIRDEQRPYLYINRVGVVIPRSGYGTILMKYAALKAQTYGLRIELDSNKEASGFYQKLGLVNECRARFVWSREDIKRFIERR